ncbi:MAG: hypothetical protein ACREM6_12330 [Vulcanimicrobiaceae bacterium]
MTELGIAQTLGAIGTRMHDVLGAYQSGFVPVARDAGGGPHRVATADPLTVVAPDASYFLIGGGRAARGYTRDGSFVVRNGELQARDGGAVLGFRLDAGSPAPLIVDPVDLALGRVRDLRIERDGSLVYNRRTIEPRSGAPRAKRVVVGRLALARFPAGTLPVRVGPTRVDAPAGVLPHVGRPGDDGFTTLATHSRDLGSVDLLSALERLQEAYESFQAAAAAQRAQRGLEKTALDIVK